MMERYDAVIVGSGLSGLTAALELSENQKSVIVLEKENVIGGRTSSWDEDGMLVESGFHRHIGFYKELPRILKKAGISINQIVQWEEQVDVRVKGKKDTAVFGISPVFGPFEMVRGLIGNNHIVSMKDKLSLVPFLLKGFLEYKRNPDKLDQYSVKEFAEKHQVSQNALHYLIIPLSAGVFFLPPERYSAKVFFGLFYPVLPRFYKMRIGAYLGGMTELLANPIATKIEQNKGEVRTGAKVKRLIVENNQVTGVILADGEELRGNNVILAADLAGAKKILKDSFAEHLAFQTLFQLPTMPAVTVQMEFSKPVLPYDRTTFGPLTLLGSFVEQSRSTFTHVPGRLSIILTPPEKFIPMKEEEIIREVIDEAYELGLDLESNLLNYRIVSHPEDFYSLEPNNDWMRPSQRTDIKGLVLAGDYTRQPYFSTMEGAVVSGLKASQVIMEES